MTATALRSIPGQFGPPGAPPLEAVERALQGIRRLADEDRADRLFGFLEAPPFAVHWYEPSLTLTVALYGTRFWSRGLQPDRCVDWRWDVVSKEPDWYDVGWMPSGHWFGLERRWARRLWRAVNRQDLWPLCP